jgi:hypothetical protein
MRTPLFNRELRTDYRRLLLNHAEHGGRGEGTDTGEEGNPCRPSISLIERQCREATTERSLVSSPTQRGGGHLNPKPGPFSLTPFRLPTCILRAGPVLPSTSQRARRYGYLAAWRAALGVCFCPWRFPLGLLGRFMYCTTCPYPGSSFPGVSTTPGVVWRISSA